MMYGRPNHTLITTMERAEGADEGPERSQARTKQRKPSQKVILVCLQHERLSTEVSRDTSRDMAGEVGRDPLLHVPPSKHGDFHVACKRRLWMNLKDLRKKKNVAKRKKSRVYEFEETKKRETKSKIGIIERKRQRIIKEKMPER